MFLYLGTGKPNHMAYFYATRNSHYSNPKSKIPFNNLVTNIGGGMNLNGTFTAPTDGTYMFTYSGLTDSKSQWSYNPVCRVSLQVGGISIATTYTGSETLQLSFGLQAVVCLKAGTKVNLYLWSGSIADNKNHYNHFTGIQLA